MTTTPHEPRRTSANDPCQYLRSPHLDGLRPEKHGRDRLARRSAEERSRCRPLQSGAIGAYSEAGASCVRAMSADCIEARHRRAGRLNGPRPPDDGYPMAQPGASPRGESKNTVGRPLHSAASAGEVGQALTRMALDGEGAARSAAPCRAIAVTRADRAHRAVLLVVVLSLRLAQLDRKIAQNRLTAHDEDRYCAWTRSLAQTMAKLGVKSEAPAGQSGPTLADIVAEIDQARAPS